MYTFLLLTGILLVNIFPHILIIKKIIIPYKWRDKSKDLEPIFPSYDEAVRVRDRRRELQRSDTIQRSNTFCSLCSLELETIAMMLVHAETVHTEAVLGLHTNKHKGCLILKLKGYLPHIASLSNKHKSINQHTDRLNISYRYTVYNRQ